MQDSVLTLGEKIVLAARLAAIEHIRREIADSAMTQTDTPAANDVVYRQLADVFARALVGQRGAA